MFCVDLQSSITLSVNLLQEFYSSILYINIDFMFITNEAFVVKALTSAKGKR